MRPRETKTWIFYTVDTEGRKCIFNERTCKMPRQTKDFKELQEHLHKPHIKSIGWTTMDNVIKDINHDVKVMDTFMKKSQESLDKLKFS
tara:strand:+ start:28179 stop:28445 length:267 start_codon:yes stop_codon:yes gene_type:complete